ncbi:hypothetical protein [Methanosarcina siciliae]|nr:hypothetical protein [Methanosarcina siciliae]
MRCKSNLLVSFMYEELTPAEKEDVKQAMCRWNDKTRFNFPVEQPCYSRPDLFYHQVVKKYGWGRV